MVKDTRARIVEAAMELFWLKGYGSTSIADILSRSQVNSGSLYHFFPGKQDLLIAVLEAYRDGIGPMLLEPAWAGVDDPIERVFALLGTYRRALIDTECTYGCPIGSLALELHEADPVVRELLADNFTGWVDAVEACFDTAGGALPAGTDRRALAELALNVMEGGVMQARTYRDVAYFDRAVAQFRAPCGCADAKGKRTMTFRLAALLLLAVPAHAHAAPLASLPSVTEKVRAEADGSRSLTHSVFVAASPQDVWAAITTADGWKSWAVPTAWITAERPAVIETSYNPAARPGDPTNIENEFTRRVPQRTLVFRTIKAPAGFPHFEALRRVTQTFELAAASGGTQVTLTGTGYGGNKSGDALLAFFKGGNRVSLEMLRDRFASGPIDWTEKLKKPLK